MVVCLLSSLIVLTVALIAMSITVKRLSKEIDKIKEILEFRRVKYQHLDFYDLSEHEDRLYKLEQALELKEYFDEETLNEEDNE